ncbi:D-aminoacyl-tRNA deacylase [Candidatus Thioglobus sp.]|jgi:D-tyrosyl-tRNA(Tyr) deacylase|nr:D-aminoacyl-tRNA deacylase [Candidatus Thioglobus sp.]MDA9060709.1 D-aminoacyl-tRNA deacylase [Candidatus Thioglobus sp.]
MKALLQRVSSSKVEVEGKVVGQISKGLLVFIGIEKQDDIMSSDKMVKKILSYRVFPDPDEKMNLSIRDINGELLIVSQFTLAADTKNGTRAGFSKAMLPNEAEKLYNNFLEKTQSMGTITESGIFGADMQVSIVNDGPVTFLLET